MSNMLKILLVVGLLSLCLANTHLNVKYRDFLNGAGEYNEAQAREIYSQFHSIHREKSEFRFNVFAETLKEIRAHNQGKHTWVQGLNDFSDMTFEEFKQDKLMTPQNCSATNSFTLPQKTVSIPDSYDWTATGMVSPVKNQGSCGSCWTFSTVGSLESHWNILGKGKNQTFSEQQLVDCAGDFDNHGCHGGLPSHAFEYIRHVGGIESDITYPYTAKDGSCVFRRNIAVGYVRFGSYNITQGDEKELADRLYSVGPVAVSFQVITGFKNYAGGVYTVDTCGKTTQDVNHAVLATGYGNESGKDFWNVKNSWGATWGVSGYFKIQRGVNMCAIAQCNSFPLIERPF